MNRRHRKLVSTAIYIVACCISFAHATPIAGYSFNSQIPLIAHFGDFYNYQLQADTFISSDGSPIVYSAQGLPDWLNFDSSSRTLYGTPPQGDQDQSVTFFLTASDSTGNSTSNASLIVSSHAAPLVVSDLASQLETFGPVADSNTLVLTPGLSFSVQFSNDTFSTENTTSSPNNLPILGYFGTMSDHSPLPIWLNFDANDLKFYGIAPSINSDIAPAEYFNIALLASQYIGFTSSQLDFNLAIGAHQFYTNVTRDVVQVSPGQFLQYIIPLGEISLDDSSLTTQNISSISVNNTGSNLDWINVNSDNATLTGIVPKSFSSDTLSISVKDSFQDSIEYVLVIDCVNNTNSSMPSIFPTKSIGPVNATRGTFFQYQIPVNTTGDDDVSIGATFNPPTDWLKFNQDNNTLTGVVPSSFDKSNVTLSEGSGNSQQSFSFVIQGIANKAVITSSSTTSSASSTSSATSTQHTSSSATAAPVAKGSSGGASSRTVAIVCGVVIPLCVIAALLILFCCCRRKRTTKKEGGLSSKEISAPILPHGLDKSDPSLNHIAAYKYDPEKQIVTPIIDTGMDDADKRAMETGDWDSPRRVSAFNYLNMDGRSNQKDVTDNQGQNQSSVGDTKNSSAVADLAVASAPAVPQRVLSRDSSQNKLSRSDNPGVPRNSWRHVVESDRRWQDRQSMMSLATVSTDELLSVRLVDNDEDLTKPRNTYMNPTKSTILTPRHSIVENGELEDEEDTSPILRRIGSPGSDSDADIRTTNVAPVIGKSQSMNLGSVGEEEIDSYRPQKTDLGSNRVGDLSKESIDTDSVNEQYKTASSGEDEDQYDDLDHYSSSDTGEDIIRPLRNDEGTLTWTHVPPIQFGRALDGSEGDDSGVETEKEDQWNHDGSKVFGDSSESQRQSNVSRADTAKLVEFTKGRSMSQSDPSGPSVGIKPKNPNIGHSVSAELAFL